MLTVLTDFKSPYAFVANELIWSLEARYNIEIDWLPLSLNIASFAGSATKSDKKTSTPSGNRSDRQWAVIRYAYMDARRYAENQGLTLMGPKQVWNSDLACVGLLWAKRQASTRGQLKDFMDLCFERFFKRQFEVDSLDAVSGLLKQAGLSIDEFAEFAASDGMAEHLELQERLLDKGCFGLPTFLVDNEVYFGREHLARVCWHLEGSKGDPPLKAYPWLGEEGSWKIT